MYEYQAQLIRVVDGDTVHMRVDLGMNISVEATLRLVGVNCPEHGTPEGEAATAFTTDWLAAHGPRFVVQTTKDKREKYGRYLARVNSPDQNCLNDDLRAAGHAVSYDGGKR